MNTKRRIHMRARNIIAYLIVQVTRAVQDLLLKKVAGDDGNVDYIDISMFGPLPEAVREAFAPDQVYIEAKSSGLKPWSHYGCGSQERSRFKALGLIPYRLSERLREHITNNFSEDTLFAREAENSKYITSTLIPTPVDKAIKEVFDYVYNSNPGGQTRKMTKDRIEVTLTAKNYIEHALHFPSVTKAFTETRKGKSFIRVYESKDAR